MKLKSKNITHTALFAATIAILSIISVPIGTVPISLGLLGVLISAIALGPARSATAVLVYLFIGAVGIPVFSGFQAGISVLAGPTGGYLFSYLAVAAITGAFAKLAGKKSEKAALLITIAGCFLGLLACYVIGTAYYSLITETEPFAALTVCVFPFIPFDIIKCVAAALFALRLNTITK